MNASTNKIKIRDRVFELVDTKILDGIIAPLGSLASYINYEETVKFINRFLDVPIVNIEGNYEHNNCFS